MTTIHVSFTLPSGQRFAGAVPAHDVVHLALDRLLPDEIRAGHHLRLFKGDDLIFPDMFLQEIVDHYGDADFALEAIPLDLSTERPFTNFGVDHLAVALEDRDAARRFFSEGLGMHIARDDEHITVVTTGNTALFLFDFDPDAPLAPPAPSRIHHLGLVVDDLEAAAAHLHRQFPDFLGHGTLLERAERLSLYGHVQFGSISFMIQLSQIKAPYRGLTTEPARQAADELYDYASRDYGIRLG
ncbi:MAG: VOC family protein [Anaerolineales bacterium]|nr:VOC family protein [Anaerolineales bacterium]MCB9128049.1 VOC family protein [Ardenticatenales bacterium]